MFEKNAVSFERVSICIELKKLAERGIHCTHSPVAVAL